MLGRLKVRVIPTLLFKGTGLVKGVAFDSWRRVGTALPAVKVYNTRQVDELVFLDIAATSEGRTVDYEEVDRIADECFMPLAVGGGISTTEQMKRLLRAGADKIVINSAAVRRPQLLTEGAAAFGAQCMVASIDARREGGGWKVYIDSGKTRTDLDVVDWAKRARKAGAGEILLTSVELDGTLKGYDVELMRAVASAVDIPVIASGGAGEYAHMADAIKIGGASAVAAASMFHFTHRTPLEAKQYLHEQGIQVRL